jgi:hypothetical protein
VLLRASRIGELTREELAEAVQEAWLAQDHRHEYYESVTSLSTTVGKRIRIAGHRFPQARCRRGASSS